MSFPSNPFMQNPFMNLPVQVGKDSFARQEFQKELALAQTRFKNVNIGDTIKVWWDADPDHGAKSEFEGVVYRLDLQSGNLVMRDGRVWMQTLINRARQVVVLESSFIPVNPFMMQ